METPKNSHETAAENAVFGLDSGYAVPHFSRGDWMVKGGNR